MPENEAVSLEDIDRAAVAISQSSITVSFSDQQKYIEAFTKIGEEKFSLAQEVDRLKRAKRTSDILDELIVPYASKAYIFMCCYCGFAGAALIANALKIRGFSIDNSVLQILVGSTAVTVIGLVGMVLTGIFVGARKI